MCFKEIMYALINVYDFSIRLFKIYFIIEFFLYEKNLF